MQSAPALPISVIVRTKDRPVLLREAIDSIRATGYPCEIVVVNDGGARVELEGITLVEHDTTRGRSEAANSGIRAAANAFVAFLDDDDIYYPQHLGTLARAAANDLHEAWYTDAVSAFLSPGEDGNTVTQSRLRLFSNDFDRSSLLTDNFIPLPTLLMRREHILELGGFDPTFELFEDWDLLIRLSAFGDFVHIPQITCEIRQVAGARSITAARPEGSEAFRAAKLKIWRKHSSALSHALFADVIERQKRQLGDYHNEAVERRGVVGRLSLEIERMEREKVYAHDLGLRAAALEGALSETRAHALRLESEMEQRAIAITRGTEEITRLNDQHAELRTFYDEAQTTIKALYGEIHRLQGLLETIYVSRTWKLHTLAQKMKGKA